jgi:hypothetical protein
MPICCSVAWCDDPDSAIVFRLVRDGDLDPEAVETVRCLFATETVTGVNIAFDVLCLVEWGFLPIDLVLQRYAQGCILDVGALERIAEIQKQTTRKELSLAMLSRVYGVQIEVDKHATDADGDEVRTSYAKLIGLHPDDWPEEYRTYALGDAIAGARIVSRQIERHGENIDPDDWAELSRKSFWLRQISNNGLTTDPDRVEALARLASEQLETLGEIAREFGLIREDGSRDMKVIRARVTEAYDDVPPMTEEPRHRKSLKPFVPNVKTSKDVLIESGDPLLEAFAEYGEWLAVERKDLDFLRQWIVHTKFGHADTLRTTSARPNLQNIRRKAGIRECFAPRDPARALVTVDHGGLELGTLAQCCVTYLGRWDMAEKINRGEDLHSHVGCEILGTDYQSFRERISQGDPEAKNARNCAKVVNFGCPGGMSAPTLTIYAKQAYGLTISTQFAHTLVDHWRSANPDGVAFLEHVRTYRIGERYDVPIPGTRITRRGCTYCSACNTFFQGLGAVVESHVGWLLTRAVAEGVIPGRPKIVNFVHDEFIFEVDRDAVTQAGDMIALIMVRGAKRHLPNVLIRAEPAAMVRWSKKAFDKRDESGNLLVHGLDYG